jgi:nitronate monooxygenase
VYGPRDTPDLEQIRALGLPFWLAGGYGSAARLREALACGAQGAQVGTAFAFCDESGMSPGLKQAALRASRARRARVFTDSRASPTGFPFKVMSLADSASEPDVVAARERICDLGYLRQCYRTPDGGIGYRCPGEPLEDYLRKGGTLAESAGRKCICNGLVAAVGYGQIRRDGALEPVLVTAGDDVAGIDRFLRPGRESYSADDVIDELLGEGGRCA